MDSDPLSRLAAQLGMKVADLITVIFNSPFELDKTSVLKEYQAIEQRLLNLPAEIADLGAGNLTELLTGSTSYARIIVSQSRAGHDLAIDVESTPTPAYSVRVMSGLYLAPANRRSQSVGRLPKDNYETRYAPFAPNNERLVNSRGLTIYDGQTVKPRLIKRNQVTAYLSLGDLFQKVPNRIYYELGSWLRTDCLSDKYQHLAYQLKLLPNVVKSIVAVRVNGLL